MVDPFLHAENNYSESLLRAAEVFPFLLGVNFLGYPENRAQAAKGKTGQLRFLNQFSFGGSRLYSWAVLSFIKIGA